ncbi:MAG: hypothetical protein PHO83_12980 [Geobacteraceae bacterium]|nr:hypothetical protein [Geobacteraceae bacterium]
MLQPGSTLGTYRIINKLGAGGMADVFLTEDTTLGRQVAVSSIPWPCGWFFLQVSKPCRMRKRPEGAVGPERSQIRWDPILQGICS